MHAHRISQTFANQDVVHIAADEVAPGFDILPDDIQIQLGLRLDASNADRKGTLMVGDQPTGVDALGSTQYQGIGLRSLDHGLWIG